MKRAVFLLMILIPICAAHASEQAKALIEGIKLYKEEKYAEAISQFLKIANAGVSNGKLFYNLGNAYLKNNDIGNAMLWYERALKLNSDDPDLKFNYEYAVSQLKDEKGEKDFPIFRILFFWKYVLSRSAVQWTAVILNGIFWLILILQTVLKKRGYATLNTLILIFALLFASTAMYNFYEATYIKEAVILPSEVPVRSGLTADSTQLFVLHAGTRVTVEKEMEDCYRIFFAEGKIGWIKKSEAGII